MNEINDMVVGTIEDVVEHANEVTLDSFADMVANKIMRKNLKYGLIGVGAYMIFVGGVWVIGKCHEHKLAKQLKADENNQINGSEEPEETEE
jgi:hypothetical protein